MAIQVTLSANEFNHAGTYNDHQYTSIRVNYTSNGRIYFHTIRNGMRLSTMAKQMKLEDGNVTISFGKNDKLIIGTYTDDSIQEENIEESEKEMESNSYTIDQLEAELEQRKFKHRSWYKEGVSVAYALKGLANSSVGSQLVKKAKKMKGEVSLFAEPEYELVIIASGSKASYRPKDDKEMLFFVYLSLQSIKEQNTKDNANPDLLHKDYLNERYLKMKEFYAEVLDSLDITITPEETEQTEEEEVITLTCSKSLHGFGHSVWINDNRYTTQSMTYYNPNGNESVTIYMHANNYDKYWEVENYIYSIMKEYAHSSDLWIILIDKLNNKYNPVNEHVSTHSPIQETTPAIKEVKQPNKIEEVFPKLDMVAEYAKVNYKDNIAEVTFSNATESHTIKLNKHKRWSHKKYVNKAIEHTGIKPSWEFRYGWEYIS